jgi:hypothetical protein
MMLDHESARIAAHQARMEEMRTFFERQRLIDEIVPRGQLVDAAGPRQIHAAALRNALRGMGQRLMKMGHALEAKAEPQGETPRLRTGEYPAV